MDKAIDELVEEVLSRLHCQSMQCLCRGVFRNLESLREGNRTSIGRGFHPMESGTKMCDALEDGVRSGVETAEPR